MIVLVGIESTVVVCISNRNLTTRLQWNLMLKSVQQNCFIIHPFILLVCIYQCSIHLYGYTVVGETFYYVHDGIKSQVDDSTVIMWLAIGGF